MLRSKYLIYTVYHARQLAYVFIEYTYVMKAVLPIKYVSSPSRRFFLSLCSGILIILFARTIPTGNATITNNHTFVSAIGLLSLLSILRLILLLMVYFFTRQHITPAQVSMWQLLIPTLMKVCCVLCFTKLIHFLHNLTVTIIITVSLTCIQLFIYLNNKKKSKLSSLALIIGFCLLPTKYTFNFSLHFQLFIIISSCFFIFSYLYLHKKIVKWNEAIPKILLKEQMIELILMPIIGLILYADGDQSAQDMLKSWQYVLDNKVNIALLIIFTILYEQTNIECINSEMESRVFVLGASGILWYNLQYMFQIQSTSYIIASTALFAVALILQLKIFKPTSFLWLVKRKVANELVQE